jgi:hypothetical protein
LALSLLAAVVSVTALAHSLRFGIELTPDGWAYWQSSVSLLEGRGYRYFFGPTIIEWPPLYPLYLAGWEYFLGVSGRTLVFANSALAGVAAFNWTAIFLWHLWKQLRRNGHVDEQACDATSLEVVRSRAQAAPANLTFASLLIVIFVSSTIVAFYRSVLAQNLVYAILPVLFYASLRCTQAAGRTFFVLAGLNALLAMMLLLAHNSAVAFLLPVAFVLARCRDQSLMARGFAIFLSSVLPLAPWLAIRSWLGQLHSHPIGRANFTVAEYLDQIIGDSADLLLTVRFGLGFVALLFIIGYIWWQLQQAKESLVVVLAIRTYLLFSVLASVCLLGIFMLTWINDPLGTRFILFLPLTLFSSAVCLLTSRVAFSQAGHTDGRRPLRAVPALLFCGIYPAAILTCLSAVAAIRLAYWTSYVDPFSRDFRIAEWRPGDHYPHGAYTDFTIDPRVTSGPPVVRENKMVVPPPCYRWIELRMQEKPLEAIRPQGGH